MKPRTAWPIAAMMLSFSGLASCTTPREESLPVAYPGYTGEYPGFTLVLDERFDRFDPEIWTKGDGAVGSEAMCRFTASGVQVADGLLELSIREEHVPASWSDDHQMHKDAYDYACGELRTRPDKRVRYGRLEARMKAPPRHQASGYITSLFTYVAEGSPREWEEIDIELEGGRPDKFQANLIYGIDAWDWWSTRQWGAWEDKIIVGPVDAWRVFAIEWVPDSIKWFVDGQLVKTLHQSDIDCQPGCVPPQKMPTPIPDNPTNIMMNFWIPNDGIQDEFGGNKRLNVYPLKTQYDWFRYYELDSEPDLLGRFDRDKDLYLAHFDVKTDVDDVHSVAAVATMLADPRFSRVRYHAVAGAYGIQEGLYVPAERVFDLAFGEHWSDAHGDFDKALADVLRLSVEALNKGGSIWISEAGQSDFSAALIRELLELIPESTVRDRVHVVQHADWNEEVTTAEDLAFVKQAASYQKIPDGNAPGNGSPGFRSTAVVNWQEHVSEGRLMETWTAAIEIANRYNGADGRYLNEAVLAGGLDFSDVAETAWIFGFNDLADADAFFDEFSNAR